MKPRPTLASELRSMSADNRNTVLGMAAELALPHYTDKKEKNTMTAEDARKIADERSYSQQQINRMFLEQINDQIKKTAECARYEVRIEMPVRLFAMSCCPGTSTPVWSEVTARDILNQLKLDGFEIDQYHDSWTISWAIPIDREEKKDVIDPRKQSKPTTNPPVL